MVQKQQLWSIADDSESLTQPGRTMISFEGQPWGAQTTGGPGCVNRLEATGSLEVCIVPAPDPGIFRVYFAWVFWKKTASEEWQHAGSLLYMGLLEKNCLRGMATRWEL